MSDPLRKGWTVLAGALVLLVLGWGLMGRVPSPEAVAPVEEVGAPGDSADEAAPQEAEAPESAAGAARPVGGASGPAGAPGGEVPGTPRSTGDVPILLVPGWLDTARDLAALRIRFLGAGWPADFVETLTFEEPTGSNRIHARELAVAVDSLLARTGATELDIVAHSMGGLATRWYLLRAEDPRVRKVVFMGSPHRGTLAAHLAWGEGRDEMMPDSPLLDTLNAAPPVPDQVEAITIRTLMETHIVPGESATLPGVPDYELCCPTHPGLIRDEEAFRIALDFLEGG